MTVPSASTTSRLRTQSFVTPYFTALGPPLFSAKLPPMVHVPREAGSTAYIKPSAAAALDNSSVMTPGSTTAWWFRVSMATIRFMRRVLNRMPP